MLTQICPIQNREKYLLSVMLAITLLFANLSKLVAICNILSKYCLCQNRKPFFDLPRQRCAHNCLPTTLHGPHRGEAYSQHCAIVGRRRALRSVAWWGVGWPLSAAIQSRAPLLGNLCKFGRGPHRCVLNSGFCAAAMCLRQPFTLTSACYYQALEHCQAPPLNTIIIQSPLNTNTLYSL